MEGAGGGGGGGAAAAGGPRVVVFDLDGCVWYPEMYMLWGGGSPFTTQPNGDLVDSSGRKTYLMGAVREIFQELHTEPQWKGAKVGIASSCDEPSWARECLKKFTVGSGTPLQAIVDDNLIEIYKARSKQEHLTQISKKSGVPFEQIMFLDNERGNCNAVSKLGVTLADQRPGGLSCSQHSLTACRRLTG